MTRSAVPLLTENQPFGPLTSLGTGGKARWFCSATTEVDVSAALTWATAQGLPVFILGGGTNLVVADAGFDGLVVQIALQGVRFDETARADRVRVTAAAGHAWDDVVRQSCDRGLSGLECLSGIPGTVGATPIQNVGAYGQDVAQTLVDVRCLERATGRTLSFDNDQCGFGYRSSRFKHQDQGRYVVLEVCFELSRSAPAPARYPELQNAMNTALRDSTSANGVRQCVLQLRAAKSMLLDRGDPNGRSCGSFFMNPIVSAEVFAELCARATPDVPPSHPEANGHVKVPAAWLIQSAGFSRGARRGNVGLSTKHTLCVVAHAGATSDEVLEWARQIRTKVHDRFGISLEPEPQLVALNF